MTSHSFAAQVAACSLAALLAGPCVILAEDEDTKALDTYVVSATRVETPKENVGSAVSKVTHDQIEARQIITFDEVIRIAPGVTVAPSGQRGSISSVFLRGTESDHTQIVIDGIRINDSNILPNIFLGGEYAHHMESVEILRGPQSALYGGEAIGGVIALTTPRATGDPLLTWETSAGSFQSFDSVLSAQIADGPAAWSLSLGREMTDNSRPNNDFEQFFYSGRFDVDFSDQLRAGFTARGANRTFEMPGTVLWPDPDDWGESEFSLWTAWLEADLTDIWNSRLTGGFLDLENRYEFPPYGNSREHYQKDTVDWRNVVSWNDHLTSVFGVEWETSKTTKNIYSINEKESILAAYGQQSVTLFDDLSLTGGGRWEEYDSFGSIWTWRTAGAYRIERTGTVLRSSYGTGFRAPSFDDLYGFYPAFPPYPPYLGNPALRPETSEGWDAGIEQRLGNAATLGLTWFANDIQDMIVIDYAAVPNTASNAEMAHTEGLEAELRGSLQDRVFWQVAYTYLEADNETSGTRLPRRPEHTLGFDLRTVWLDDRLTLGFGGYSVQNRVDPFGPLGDYFLARAYGAFQLTENLTVQLRLENAFDEDYDEISGYPGRPQGVFGGVKLNF